MLFEVGSGLAKREWKVIQLLSDPFHFVLTSRFRRQAFLKERKRFGFAPEAEVNAADGPRLCLKSQRLGGISWMHRYELGDEQWALVAGLLPVQRMGRPRHDDRLMLNAAFWVLHSGAPWRDLPERYGAWQSAYARFRAWQHQGVFARILHALQWKLDGEGLIEPGTWAMDATSIRAARPAAGAPRRKKGLSTSHPTTRSAAAVAG